MSHNDEQPQNIANSPIDVSATLYFDRDTGNYQFLVYADGLAYQTDPFSSGIVPEIDSLRQHVTSSLPTLHEDGRDDTSYGNAPNNRESPLGGNITDPGPRIQSEFQPGFDTDHEHFINTLLQNLRSTQGLDFPVPSVATPLVSTIPEADEAAALIQSLPLELRQLVTGLPVRLNTEDLRSLGIFDDDDDDESDQIIVTDIDDDTYRRIFGPEHSSDGGEEEVLWSILNHTRGQPSARGDTANPATGAVPESRVTEAVTASGTSTSEGNTATRSRRRLRSIFRTRISGQRIRSLFTRRRNPTDSSSGNQED